MLRDRNTSFYHKFVKVRRKQNRILTLRHENGDLEDDQERLKEMAVDYFHRIYTASQSFIVGSAIPNRFPHVMSDMKEELVKEATNEEIVATIHSMHPLKAPGKDGLHALFFQK